MTGQVGGIGEAPTTARGIMVRPVRPSEHELVGALVLAAYDRAGRIAAGYRVELADTAARNDDESEVLVAVDRAGAGATAGAVLGTVTIVTACSTHFEHAGHGDGGFRALAVAPEAQGQGVGRRLVRAVVAEGRRRGWRRLAISTMDWMVDAQRLYARLGFDRRPDLDVRYPTGIGHAYTRDLADDGATHFPPPGPAPAVVPWFEDARPDAGPGC